MKGLRHLPAVHRLKRDAIFLDTLKTGRISEDALTDLLTKQIDDVRQEIIENKLNDEELNESLLSRLIFNKLQDELAHLEKNNLQNVINATGVVLHTNLGRARLSDDAIKHVTNVAQSYSTLEYNIDTGKRGSRHDIVESYLKELTGAEAAMVVNNNAAAVYLTLKAIASEKEAIISRGELVEIGGSFRISDIMEESDVAIVEVGTTNKTKLPDYEAAITEETGLLLKVHKSNFKIVGFTEEVTTEELVLLRENYGIPIYEDLGSGTLFNFMDEEIGEEPTVQQKVKAGIDLISFSGDKLLGGPQAGIIVGKSEYINKLKKHQLARVLRVDKFTLAALEATLKIYQGQREKEEIPTIRDLLKSKTELKETAETFINKVERQGTSYSCEIVNEVSKVGGGTMPDVDIETYVVRVTHEKMTSDELAEKLREQHIPVIVRVKRDAVLLDFRTVTAEEFALVLNAFLNIQ